MLLFIIPPADILKETSVVLPYINADWIDA